MRTTGGVFPDDILELHGISPALSVSKSRENAICLLCRSAELLCGKPSCPILLKAKVFMKIRSRLDSPEIV